MLSLNKIKINPIFCVTFGFISLLTLRDILKIYVPLELFLIVLCLMVWFFKKSDFAIIGVITTLLGHGVQVPSLFTICLLVILVKFIIPGKLKFGKISLCILGLSLIELFNIIIYPYSNFVEFIRYVISLFFMAFLLDNTDDSNQGVGTKIFKYYISIYVFTMLDILYQIVVKFGSITYIINNGIRFGNLAEKGNALVSLYDNENNIALFSLIAVTACIAELWKHENNQNKPILLCLLILSSFFGFMTLSKAFLCSYLFLGLLVLLNTFIQSNVKIINKIIIIISSIFGVAFLYNEVFIDVINNIFLRIDTTEITTGRLNLFNLYNDYMINNPEFWWFGIGIQNPVDKTGIWNSMHNAIQQVYVSFGFIGLLLFVILVVCIYKKAKRQRNTKLSYANLIVPMALFIYTQSIQFMSSSSIFMFLVFSYYYMAYPYNKM